MSTKKDRLDNVLGKLPDFVFDFIKNDYEGDSINTQLGYANDIKTFLNYLVTLPKFKDMESIEKFKHEDMELVDLMMLNNYKAYLEKYTTSFYSPSGKLITMEVTNDKKGILRKLSTLRSLFKFLFLAELITKNVTEKVKLPKINHLMKKPLGVYECMNLVDVIMNGEKYFGKRELSGYKNRKQRDIAMFITLLGTGIRISELVKLDIDHLDFDNSNFIVRRKGGKYDIIHMPIQVENELYLYLEGRKKLTEVKDKNALFISNRGTRISVAVIEKLLKAYCSKVGIHNPDKTTVHALRRTFACNLLEDGIDIKAVSELLGHRDISVTSRFYAQHSSKTHMKIMRNVKVPTKGDTAVNS